MSKLARAVLDTISAFPPNRDTLGATAYLIVENQTNFLIDCPAWDRENQQFLQEQGGVSWLIVTHRGGIGKVKEIQAAFGCQVLIQEQEAYLLPDVEVKTFQHEFNLSPQTQVIWTPGHSPGSSCVYSATQGGVLFSGRHLLPNQQGLPVPLRTSKTFHWWRQLRSVALLRDRFSPNTLNYLCPGANTGFLRGKRIIEQAYEHLATLDLDAMRETQPQF
ncbi:MBL fold metallo-hydrolase [[Phormidium ambiguum] IAM M-71]|uniref:MBL fold metallo-hydrolase n=1 Tax=[Phormidium ambiguum] IAM M-71 TaxID=454136 RepID=A0A1U7IHE8_9CYAN|nr:MBL fold metallo-hydrolase [Phormidium ambiguum]OKH36562.1 MBL fold metallo-hydrolase [Phormidium ambiguum IAM M-71]